MHARTHATVRAPRPRRARARLPRGLRSMCEANGGLSHTAGLEDARPLPVQEELGHPVRTARASRLLVAGRQRRQGWTAERIRVSAMAGQKAAALSDFGIERP